VVAVIVTLQQTTVVLAYKILVPAVANVTGQWSPCCYCLTRSL